MEVRDDYYEHDASVAAKDYRMLTQGFRGDGYELKSSQTKPSQTKSASSKGKQVHYRKSWQQEDDSDENDDSNESDDDSDDDDFFE